MFKVILSTVAIASVLSAACTPPPPPPPTRYTPPAPFEPGQPDPYGDSVDPEAPSTPDAPDAPSAPAEYPTARKTTNPNEVVSPYEPFNLIDVEGFTSGQLARDPSNQKIFRVP